MWKSARSNAIDSPWAMGTGQVLRGRDWSVRIAGESTEIDGKQYNSIGDLAQLACLSHVLRQLIVFHSDLHRFVTDLKQRLGPQLQNVPLLYEGAPELKTIFSLFDITIEPPRETLETNELPARFQSLVENVFSVLAGMRLFALFLDDLHEAPDS